MAMEFDIPTIMMDSQWEYTDYEPSNIHIYEKEFHDYVVYYVAQGDSRLFSGSSQRTSSSGILGQCEKKALQRMRLCFMSTRYRLCVSHVSHIYSRQVKASLTLPLAQTS